jgi:hypothetical protein
MNDEEAKAEIGNELHKAAERWCRQSEEQNHLEYMLTSLRGLVSPNYDWRRDEMVDVLTVHIETLSAMTKGGRRAYMLTDEVADYLIDMLNTELENVREDLNEHADNYPTGCTKACMFCTEYNRQLRLAEEAYDTLRSIDGSNGDTYHTLIANTTYQAQQAQQARQETKQS